MRRCPDCGDPLPKNDRRRKYCSDRCRKNASQKRVKRASPRHLRAVEPNERRNPLDPRQLTVDVAAKEGTELELLMALRDRIATQISDPNCSSRDLAALSKRLEELRKSISAERLRLKEELADADDVEDEALEASSL
jgi:hypothetical protein